MSSAVKMSVESISFKKQSPELEKFLKQSWKQVTSFQEFEAELEAKQRTPPTNPSFSRFMNMTRSTPSMKVKRKPTSIFNASNGSADRSSFGKSRFEDDEKFVIEEVSSDDEPKEKKVGLCTEKGNRIMVNLSRRRNRGSTGDPESSNQSKSSANYSRSLDGSYSFVRNSSFGNRSTSSETSIKSPSSKKSRKHLKVSDQSKPSIEMRTELRPSQSISDTVTPEKQQLNKPIEQSSKPPNKLTDMPVDKPKSDSSALLSRKKLNLVTHSTPKETSKVLKKLDQMVKDCSPLRPSKNDALDSNDSPTRTKGPVQSRNAKITKDDRPKTANRSKARTLFNSTNTEFNKEFHGSPVRQPLSQTISDPESPVVQNKSKRPVMKLSTTDSVGRRFQQIDQFETPTKQRPTNLCTSLVPYVDPYRTPTKQLKVLASQRISQCDSPVAERTKATESRCFLRLSKKMDKLLTNHQLAKMNESKRAEQQKQPLLYELFESIHQRIEEQKIWLSANKKDDVERDSLFLKLTRVAEPRNGFVDCDCVIDVSRMKKVILFKYPQLKTMIPTHYANQFEISGGAVLEYIGPWCTYDCDKLRLTFVQNPFWVNILDHGRAKSKADEYEVVWTNPDLNVDNNMLLALTE